MKLLVLDIETAPTISYTWRLFKENIPIQRVIQPGYVLCWGARWHGEKKLRFGSDFHDGHEGMLAGIHELMTAADGIITYNGQSFDIPHLHREFFLAGLMPPAPHHDIDLYRTVRRKFKFISNKLDWVSQETGIGQKIKHDGFELWPACMENDPAAWAKMKRYCLHDVELTDDLYVKLLPWLNNHPHAGLYTEDEHASKCGRCGSFDLIRMGFKTTKVGKYQRFQCKQCGTWSQGRNNQRTIGVRPS